MNNSNVKKGTKIKYKHTGVIFEIDLVTEKRVSWFVSNSYKGGNGINTLSKAWTSRANFENCIINGTYIIESI